jgi:hypothetical protein
MRSGLLLAGLASLVRYVNACGGFFCQPNSPVLQAGENIAFGVEQKFFFGDDVVEVTMVVQINYQGPAEGFGWLLPVPSLPELDVGSDILFTALFDASRPNFSFTIDNSRSTTCNTDLFPVCANSPTEFEDSTGSNGSPVAEEAEVVDSGTVGPFEFVTLQAADNRPESIFEWLGENGFDQPDDAAPLINYYAEMGMLFVALRLKKQSETGDIRPIILEYRMAGSLEEETSVACVPIQLTRIAATPKMPIQIYSLGPSRGFPVNYLDVTLDDHLIDWVGCYRSGQDCFLQDWRDQFGVVVDGLDGHAFITEYAGSSADLGITVELAIDLAELKDNTDPLSFLNALNDANVPAISLVHNIIEQFIPNEYLSTDLPCSGNANVYTPATPGLMSSCVEYVDFGGATFNGVALADALEKDVFEPARTAQEFVDRYPYLTRLYAQLDPEQMNRDPFFAFNRELEEVPLAHTATGVPVCGEDNGFPIGLDIYVGKSDQAPVNVEASLGCGAWFRSGVIGAPFPMSPALALTAYDYEGLSARVLTRNEATGQFSMEDVKEVFEIMDTRVPNQTIPEFQALPTTAPESPVATDPPMVKDPPGDSGALASLTFAVFIASLATASLFI